MPCRHAQDIFLEYAAQPTCRQVQFLDSARSGRDRRFEEYSYATALFFYRSQTGYRLITQRLKYHSDYAAGRYFASMLGREMASSPVYSDVDAVIPVPLHWTRLWSRGHNQAEIIAEVLAEYLKADLLTDILYRARHTRTQTKLSIEGKAHNVEGLFR